jgi:hypothetical protein
MTEALVANDLSRPLKPEQLQARLKLIQDVMRNVMREGEDYGTLPGTPKPMLFKAGAEKLCVTFRLSADRPIVEDLSTDDVIRYRLNVPIIAADGTCVGVGVGECSSGEEKYKWRKPVPGSKEWEETPADRRREVWKKAYGKVEKQKQVRTEPADLANTVLKMGHKRAFVGGTIMATGASSIFGQDIEDVPEEVRENLTDDRTPVPSEPQRKSTPVAPAGAAAKETPQPPAAAAPASPAQQRGIRVLKTSTIVDEKGNLFEIETTRGLFYTRDQGRYDEIATCEDTPTLLVFTWFNAKRQVKDKLVPIKVVDQVALDDQPPVAQTTEDSNALA